MYQNILVDAFNYFLSQKKEGDNYKSTLQDVIRLINDKLLPSLDKGGHIYFLFDPLPVNNLNISSYKRSSDRLKIASYYKQHRELSKEDIKGLILFKEYLTDRDDRFITVYDKVCEADDFTQAILDTMPDQKIALVSRDSDWCRYLSDNVFVTDFRMERELTPGDYEHQHGYYPTIASVTMDKVLFGDKADYILNVFSGLGLKYRTTVLYKLAEAYIIELGEHKDTLEEVIERIKGYGPNFTEESLPDRPAEKALFKELLFSEVGIVSNFKVDILRNIELVRSRFKGTIQKFYHHNSTPDEAYCSLIDASIGLGKFKKKFQFGV